MNGVQLISQADYARLRGVAKSAVAKAVKQNRITLIDGKIDPAVADFQWERNTRARADSGSKGDAEEASSRASPPTEMQEASGYSVDRARREKYEADLAQLKLLELQGDLVRVSEVRTEMAKAIGELRTNALQIASRLSPLLAAETDQAKVHLILDNEIRTLLRTVTSGVAQPATP